MKWKRIEVVFELLVYGVAVGVLEDIIAIKFATGEPITWRIVGIVVMIAVPFAVLGEVVFDNIDFASKFERWFGKKEIEKTESVENISK
ncbi:MAG: hypothetical protein WAX44_01310 [Minisyncoccia bacterium]